jgi:hypothetical protein
MTLQEAIDKREELLVEQRKLNLAIKVLKSETIVPCAGIMMAIGQYERRIESIDNEIRTLGDTYQAEHPAEPATEQPAEQPAEPVRDERPVEETTVSLAEESTTEPTKEQKLADLFIDLFKQAGIIH